MTNTSTTSHALPKAFAYSALATAMCMLSLQAQALEALDEAEMSEATGQAIGFVPEDFSMRFNGEGGVVDTGYIRLIPVGPLRQDPAAASALDASYDKADLWIYGLAVSQSNKNLGQARTSADLVSRFGRNIESWGSAANPWQLVAETQSNVPDFGGTTRQLSKVSIKAPSFDPSVFSATSTASAAEKSAYNLKLGLWADIFKRSSNVAENGYNGLTERARLNVIWDGFSINGSELNLFQTLGGSGTAAYNNTLGLNLLARLNSGDGQNVRATVNKSGLGAVTYVTTPGRTVNDPSETEGKVIINYIRDRAASRTGSTTWSVAPTSVLSLGTQETGTNITNDLTTPALGGATPNFNPDEGLKLYNLNVNIPLGHAYQPVVITSQGNNLTLELTRIPNVAAVYQKKYQRYALNSYETYTGLGAANTGGGATVYGGSTCNFYRCSNAAGERATHGSLTIGSTNYVNGSGQNLLYADSSEAAYGVSFGSLTGTTTKTFNAANPYYSDFQYQRRRRVDGNQFFGDGGDWQYYQTNGTWARSAEGNNEGNWSTNSVAANTAWLNYGQGTTGYDNYTPKGNELLFRETSSIKSSTASPINNLGSVAIDGIAFNHFRFSTNGAR